MTDITLTLKKSALPIASGILLTLAFPKFGMAWTAWIAFVPLFFAINGQSPRKAFGTGFGAGLVHYLTLLYWLVETMVIYGKLPMLISVIALVALSVYLALYTACFATLLARFGRRPIFLVLMAPLSWVALEYLQTILFTGFPWELLGYSQYHFLPIIQIADLSGVYGISGLIILVNTSVFLMISWGGKKNWYQVRVPLKTAAVTAVVASILFVLSLGYGYWRIKTIDRLISEAPKAKFSVVQGNVEQAAKWDPAHQYRTIQKYLDLSFAALPEKPDLIVWPETATPFYFLKPPNENLSRKIQRAIRKAGTYFLIGTPSYSWEKKDVEYFNSAFLMNPKGIQIERYDKVHLVPYGEYVPLKKWFPYLGKLVAQVGDFSPGEKGKTMPWLNRHIGIQICFEIIFPQLSRAMTQGQADVLVNITNDAWFGKTAAPYQHLSMALFRAVENRRTLVRSANTGISGFVDPTGRILEATDLFVDAVRTRSVPLLKTKTFYTRHGDLFALTALLGVLIFCVATYKMTAVSVPKA